MKWILTKVRIHQIRRQIEELGLFYSLIVLVFLCIVVFYVYVAYCQNDKSFYVFALTTLLLLMLHISRKDKEFVYQQIDHPVQNIFTEYFVYTLPFTLPSLFTSHWFYFPVSILFFYIIANIRINLKKRTMFPHLSKIISSENFEWISGLRKNYISILICLLLAIITCWIRIVPLIFLWFFITVAASFYQECESLQILFASSDSSKKMLKGKIINHSKLIVIIILPFLIVNSIFNPGMILINIAFLLVQITLLIFAILLKYTTYTPNENLKGNSILLATASLGTFIPFLLPIPIIMCFRNYGKAVRNLKFYFND